MSEDPNVRCKECGGPIPVDEDTPPYVTEYRQNEGLCGPCHDMYYHEGTGGLEPPQRKKPKKAKRQPATRKQPKDVKLTREAALSILRILSKWPGVDRIF